MRRALFVVLGVCGFCVLPALQAFAKDADDFPLRVVIFRNTEHGRHTREAKSFNDTPDYLDGILLPEPGRPWNNVSCVLHATMEPGMVFFWNDDDVMQEPAAKFKEWMVKHQFDPENGKITPIEPVPVAAPVSTQK